MNKKTLKKNLLKTLEKKANGFYYTEEVYEYEKTQNTSKNNQKQLCFLENNENFKFHDRVYPDKELPCGTIELSNEKEKNLYQSSPNLTLAKKKITTHYVPPDMLAIKTLFEVIGQEMSENSIEHLTDEELLEIKNKLIGEIVNDDIKNIQKS